MKIFKTYKILDIKKKICPLCNKKGESKSTFYIHPHQKCEHDIEKKSSEIY